MIDSVHEKPTDRAMLFGLAWMIGWLGYGCFYTEPMEIA